MSNKKNRTPEQIVQQLVWEYRDYEQKILSRHDIMRFVRDVYYIDQVGKTYEEWLIEEQTNANS